MSSDSITFSSLKWLPLYKPAVRTEGCKVNQKALDARIVTVSLTAITSMLAGMAVTATTGSVIGVGIVIGAPVAALALIILDLWLTSRAVKARAVEEYYNPDVKVPSTTASRLIREDSSAAQMLVDRKNGLDKHDDEGNPLLATTNFDVFKILVDNGANVHAKTASGDSVFERAVKNNNPRFLEYIFSQKKVTADDVKDEEQHAKLWSSFGHAKTAKLLKENGFNIDARDKDGYTALMRAAFTFVPNMWGYNAFALSFTQRVGVLLNCGANKTLTVKVKDSEKTAAQLTSIPAVKNLLEG